MRSRRSHCSLRIIVLTSALALAASCGGGSSRQPTATPTAAPVSGAGSQPTATPATSARPTPTPAPGAVPTPTPAPPGPPHSILVGEWDFNFRVVSNSCEGDPRVGTTFQYAYYFDEIREPKDGFISDGEPFKLTHVGGTYVGNLVFYWPQVLFDYPIDGGHAYVTASFRDNSTGTGALTESYDIGRGDTCSIFLRDDG